MGRLARVCALVVAATLLGSQAAAGFRYEIANILMVRLWPLGDAAMENVGRLCEWLEYNLAIGVQHFYIYDDAQSDSEAFGAHPVIQSYINDGVVTYHRLQTGPNFQPWSNDRQNRCYANAFARYQSETKWLLWIDMDEFVRLERDRTLQEFIARMSPKDTTTQFLFCNWFVSGLLLEPGNDDLRLVEQYLWRETEPWPAQQGRTKMLTVAQETKSLKSVHSATMKSGSSVVVPLEDGYLMHYWKLRSKPKKLADVQYYPRFAEQWGDYLFQRLADRADRAGLTISQLSAGPYPVLSNQAALNPAYQISSDQVDQDNSESSIDRKRQNRSNQLAHIQELLAKLRSKN